MKTKLQKAKETLFRYQRERRLTDIRYGYDSKESKAISKKITNFILKYKENSKNE